MMMRLRLKAPGIVQLYGLCALYVTTFWDIHVGTNCSNFSLHAQKPLRVCPLLEQTPWAWFMPVYEQLTYTRN